MADNDDELTASDLLLQIVAEGEKKVSAPAAPQLSIKEKRKQNVIKYASESYGETLRPLELNVDVGGALANVGAAVGHAVRASWRAIRHGEQMECADNEPKGNEPPPVVAIGDSDGGEISTYLSKWKGKNRFQAITGWYVRVAHHDPLGTDPWMMTMFLIAFVAVMFYDTFAEALFLTLILAFLGWIVWMVVRAAMPIVSKELDAAESGIITLVYNLFSISSGLAVASYVRYTWPGLLSIWRGLENKGCGSSGTNLIWAPCMDTQTFFAVALLFFFIILSSFKYFYVASWVFILLLVPFAVFTSIEYDVFNNLLLSSLSSAFFLAWMVAPIKKTYVWNMLFSISMYLFIYSIAALSDL